MNGRGRWLVVIAVAAIAGVLTGRYVGHVIKMPATSANTPIPAPTLVEGDVVPADLTLTALDGRPMPLAAYRGRPLLINVWASWCGPCVEEMPELAAFASEQGDNGTQVIGLALDTPEAVGDFLTRVPVHYPIALDTPGPHDASVALGNERGLLPYTVLIDADGRLVRRKLGPFKAGEIAAWANNGK